MIQRVQSLYILLSTGLFALLFALPFAEIIDASGAIYTFDAFGVKANSGELIQNAWAIALLLGMVLIFELVALFLFKKRILQMRILTFVMLLCLGLVGLFFFFLLKSFNNATMSYHVALVFPLVAAVLNYLAIRAIGKDEALIRSVDRIR